MGRSQLTCFLLSWIFLNGSLCIRCDAQSDVAPERSLEQEAANILVERCWSCHNTRKLSGGLSLSSIATAMHAGDSNTPSMVPGSPEQSELYRRLIESDPSLRMPSESKPLSDTEISVIYDWIAKGGLESTDVRSLASIALEGTPMRDGTPTEPYPSNFPIANMAIGSPTEIIVAGNREWMRWKIDDWSLADRRFVGERRIGAIEVGHHRIAVSSGTPGVFGAVTLYPDRLPSDSPNAESHPSVSITARKVVSVDSDIPVALAFSPTQPLLLIGTLDGRVQLYDADAKTMIMESNAHADQILSVAWNADGSEFMTGSRDRTARIYAYPSLELKCAYSGHERTIGCVGICDHGAVTLDETGTLRLWQRHEDRVLASRSGLPQHVQQFALRRNRIAWIQANSVVICDIESFEAEDGKNDDGTPKFKRRHRFANSTTLNVLPSKRLTSLKWLDDDQLIAGTAHGEMITLSRTDTQSGLDAGRFHRVLP